MKEQSTYGAPSKSQFSKKVMYNFFESTPIKIDYATVPTAEEWRATLRYQELLKNASLAPPPPPPSVSASASASASASSDGSSTATNVPPPPPPPTSTFPINP